MKRLIVLAMMIGFVGCVLPKAFDMPGLTTDEKQARWAKDYAECEDYAYQEWGKLLYGDQGKILAMPRPVPPDSIAGMHIDTFRTQCLEKRGWVRVKP